MFGRASVGRGGLVRLTFLQSTSRPAISGLRQPTCRLKSLSWLTTPNDYRWFLVAKSCRRRNLWNTSRKSVAIIPFTRLFLSRRTTAAPAAEPLSSPRSAKTKGNGKRRTSAGDSENQTPFPTPTGPMVAVYLDQPSVDKLKAQYPEARDGQLRKVVLQYGPSASEREMYRHLFSGRAEVAVRFIHAFWLTPYRTTVPFWG